MKTTNQNPTDANQQPFKCISYKAAQDLSTRYKKECQPLLSANLSNKKAQDARSIVFTLENLKRMVAEIENNTSKLTDKARLGIRVYYGKYPDIAAINQDQKHPLYKDFGGLPDEYAGLHTAFLVPVFQDKLGVFRDFDPWHSAVTGLYEPIREEKNEGPQGITPQMNHGNLCPPPFNSVNDKELGLCF